MLTLPQIKQALMDRRPGIVAEATGLHINTILKIRDDENANPTYRIMEALSGYFEKQDNLGE